MARSWRDYSAENLRPGPCDKSDNSDERAVTALEPGANVPDVPIVTGLPAGVMDGLARLRATASPRIRNPALWPQVVSDALMLAQDGWAAAAMAFGWSTLDLFGAVTDANSDPASDGLASKLAGRKVLAICASFATVANGPAGRAYLYRGGNEGARLLWALSRGR